MKHLHKCREHPSCVIIVEQDSPKNKTHIERVGNIDGSCPYHGLHLSHSVFDECMQEPEEVTDEFERAPKEIRDSWDTTHNQVTVRGEAAIIQHDIEQQKLINSHAGRLGIFRGPDVEEDRAIYIGPVSTQSSGSATPSDGSDRPVIEREDSVGRRRRRQEYDSLGILHEEGGDQR